jgi:hypothetical protein
MRPIAGASSAAVATKAPATPATWYRAKVRARRFANGVWWGLLTWVALITLASFRIQPHLKESFAAHPIAVSPAR